MWNGYVRGPAGIRMVAGRCTKWSARIERIEDWRARIARTITLTLTREEITKETICAISDAIQAHPGEVPLRILVKTPRYTARLRPGDTLSTAEPSPALFERIEHVLGEPGRLGVL